MILLDTHIWVWWVHGVDRLSATQAEEIPKHESDGLGVSAISCWEVAKLCQLGRLQLPAPINHWMQQAVAYPGIRLLGLTPEIAVESTELPGWRHRDPADQIIVATARIHDLVLLTVDQKILQYNQVKTLA